MSSNVPGAAPPQPSQDAFGGGWLAVLLGGAKDILSTRQQYELEKATIKAQGNSLAAPPAYQTGTGGSYAAPSPLENLPWEMILIVLGAGLVAIWALRK
ncbi:MAG: hypothetical protein ACK4KX_03280 [Parvibaculum sp.]|uniref:hypothetical protein n=1 Tax=Parvibaculum sp. TaxID=2024848 RepID=UPI00391BBBA1